jgi:ribosomal protein L34E
MDENKIPLNLYSEDTKQAHEHCKICGVNLRDVDTYGIQKVYKNYPNQKEAQVLFDFALCMPCMESARAELSQESRQRIDLFMREKMMDLALSGISPSERYQQQQCTLSGKDLNEANDYQVIAICQGENLVESPIYISDEILDEIQGLLSAKSREELDRFTENNLDWPPELKALIKQGDWLPI